MKERFSRFLTVVLLFCSSVVLAAPASLDELLPSEKNNAEVFQKFAPKVVFIHRFEKVGKFRQKKFVQAGAGSGIIWNEKGYIVTNYHVIKGAASLGIGMGSEIIPAKVVGFEERKDIAVLKIDDPEALSFLKNYVPFKLVHYRDVLVGQKAIAIGNPFGFDHSLSIGIVSALGRNVPGAGGANIHNTIQTDAAINPGNSGGPLLDSKGRLLGLNTVIFSSTGSSVGIGFAIPSDDLERIVPQLINNGKAMVPGIGIKRASPRMEQKLGIRNGILIDKTFPNTPAARTLQGTGKDKKGKVVAGDVIVGVNGQPVFDYDSFYSIMDAVSVGDEITLNVDRRGKELQYRIKTIDVSRYSK